MVSNISQGKVQLIKLMNKTTCTLKYFIYP